MRHGTLIASTADGYPQVSILPFVKTGDLLELHSVQPDPTFDAVRAATRVTFFPSDFLAWTPPNCGAERDAGRATLNFRPVPSHCAAQQPSTTPPDLPALLRRLL